MSCLIYRCPDFQVSSIIAGFTVIACLDVLLYVNEYYMIVLI